MGSTERTRKLTVDIPASLHDRYEDIYWDLRRVHRKLKRIEYIQLVLRFGLSNRDMIESKLQCGSANAMTVSR